MTALYLPSRLARQIEEEAVRAYPEECCGILLGRDARRQALVTGRPAELRVIERLRPVANSFDSSERFHRFAIDPRQLMQAERDAAEAGLLVLGFYHSHPDQPARPSEYDRSNAWPFYSYLIVSIHSRQGIDMTSWVLDDKESAFLRQEIVEGDQPWPLEGD